MPFGPEYRDYVRLNTWLTIGLLAANLIEMALLGFILGILA